MKERLLFLAKLVVISAVGFYLWKNFASQPYTLFLNRSISFVRPFFINSNANLRILNKVPYFYLVFLSMVLATPHTPILRRIKLLLTGTLVFFAFDFFAVFFGITLIVNQSNYSYLSATYHTLLPILAIALWIVPNLSQIGRLFEKPALVPQVSPRNRICPVCKKEKTGLLDHIRSSHSEKSLRSWKVKRFLAKTRVEA